MLLPIWIQIGFTFNLLPIWFPNWYLLLGLVLGFKSCYQFGSKLVSIFYFYYQFGLQIGIDFNSTTNFDDSTNVGVPIQRYQLGNTNLGVPRCCDQLGAANLALQICRFQFGSTNWE